MNGIQEVSGSIPLISTRNTAPQNAVLYFCIWGLGIGPLTPNIVSVRVFLVRPRQGEIQLRLILDRHSLELFANEVEQAATVILYTDLNIDAISFEVDGCIAVDVEKYVLVFGRGAEA